MRASGALRLPIGENVARLKAIVSNRQVPWSSIKRMRDRLAHHCEATEYDAVWATSPGVQVAMSAALAPG